MTSTQSTATEGRFAAHIDRMEIAICNRLIASALNHPKGLTLRAWDGEEWAGEWTSEAAIIREQIGHTCETSLCLRLPAEPGAGPRPLGTILLVHGNGDDLIANWSWSERAPDSEAIMAAIVAHAGEPA